MRFSVIVPVFRVEKYIEECLDSIRRQSFEDFECIMVDDGSDDRCPEICDDFAARDTRFKVIHKANGGPVSARKAGAEAAEGDYIVCVDGDDFVDAALLQTLHGIIEEHSPDSVIYGANRYTDHAEGSFCSNVPVGYYSGEALETIFDAFLYDPDVKGINDGSILFYMWCKCVKRQQYIACQRAVDESISNGEDVVFTLRWKSETHCACFTDYCGYFYRSNEGSLERSFKRDCLDKLDFLTGEMRRICPEFDDKINVFYFYRALKFCLLAAQQLGYGGYMRFVREHFRKERMLIIKSAQLKRHTAASFVKYQLVRNRMWRILYLLANTWFAGKFG